MCCFGETLLILPEFSLNWSQVELNIGAKVLAKEQFEQTASVLHIVFIWGQSAGWAVVKHI